MTAKKRNRWLQLAALAIGAGAIYQLPYLRYTYYDSMMQAFQVNNTQLGLMMSVFGLACIFFYFPGGWLSDKFSQRKILAIGQILTGAAGLLFATFPPFAVAMTISVFWAFSTAMVFWTALISYTRSLGNDAEQGRIYGLLEGGRGAAATLIGLVIVPIFASLGSGVAGLRAVIMIWAIIGIIMGVVCWFVLVDDVKPAKSASKAEPEGPHGIIAAIKSPAVWMVTLIFFATMNCFDCLGYMTPYLTSVCGLSVAAAATIGVIRTWGLQIGGGVAGGFIADKITKTRTMIISFIIIGIGFIVFLLLPGGPGLVVLLVAVMLVFGFMVFVNRGIYFATLSEAKVPVSLMGGATALITALGGSPDAYIYTLIGHWLDVYGNAGYNYVFIYAACCAVIGLVATLNLRRIIRKANAVEPAKADRELEEKQAM